MEMVLCAADLLVWAQQLLLDRELAVAEPRTLSHRLLHLAGRLVHRARQVWLRLPDQGALDQRPARRLPAPRRPPDQGPWTSDLLAAYRRLAAITRPPGSA